MTRTSARWAGAAAFAVIPLVLIGLPVLAQRAGDQGSSRMNNAKQAYDMIQGGQLNLRDAAALAEKHTKGTALEARFTIQTGTMTPEKPGERPGEKPGTPPPGQPKPGGVSYGLDQQQPGQRPPAGDEDKSGARRLVYEITCFAGDKVQLVRVDGLEKKVIDAKDSNEPTTPRPMPPGGSREP